MKKLIIVTLLAFVGCTKTPVCDAGKAVSGVVSAQIAVQLECKNVDAIKAYIDGQLSKANICGPAATGVIGDVVCGPFVDGLLSGALAQVPSDWQCTGGPAKDVLKTKLLDACKKAI